jgi:histidine triad (HIT) family protein
MSDCLFCKIIAGDISARKIYEDEEFLSFLDIFPANRGHALVIPKSHHQDIQAISEELYGKLALRVKRVSDILTEKLSPDGVTVFQMNKSAGWQSVFHIHFHVIPRWDGDDLHKPWSIAPGVESELEELQQLIGLHRG